MPEKTEMAEILPAAFDSPQLHEIYAIWNEQRGTRAMPERNDMLPRPLGRLLRYISLVKFLSETGDYEFRIIGDEHVQAYGLNAQGTKFSTLIGQTPEFGAILKYTYDLVRKRRTPTGFRGLMGRDLTHARFDWLETLYLPLAPEDGDVDYILNASVYRPRDGKWPA